MDLKEEDILGEHIHTHWYYVAKGKAMRSFLGDIKTKEVLDVGAGSGIFSKQLLDHDIADAAVCIDLNYPEERHETHSEKPIKFITQQNSTSQDLIIIMDVLEHVPDDLALLKSYVDSMAPGGKVFITVPAFQFLWSGHDVFLEHYRRYTIDMVEKLVIKAGLKPLKSRYFFGALFPLIAAIRCLNSVFKGKKKDNAKSDLALYPGWINAMLTFVHDIERFTLFKVNRLFGLSVFCICEKK